MSQSGYTAWAVTAGEIPTTAYWNILGSNDAAFNTGNGFNDGAVVARHINSQLGPVITSTTAGEVTYVNGTYVDVTGSNATVTTTVTNQNVVVFCGIQTYSGGYSNFRFTVDGIPVTNTSKYQTQTNNVTTGFFLYMDAFIIGAAGTHVIQLQANSGATLLRIIHGEGQGRMVVLQV